MLRLLSVTASWCASLVLLAQPVSAQWFSPANACDCAPAAYTAAPAVSACTVCAPVVQTACVQPVMQTVYRQVPVVELQPTRQTVKKPIVETKYVDQAVTEYRPVTETRMVDVPTISYQDITEYQQVCRNVGYYRTRCEPNLKMSPCQYDGRPGFMGWLNRSSYELATAFTPNYRTTREYVPQTIVQTVPTTRRVAVQGTRQVAYNVTNMVAHQTTRKVAVAETKWIDEEVTVMKPVTVVKTMAVGTQITYQPLGADGTATALRPYPETTINARGSTNSRSADALDKADPSKVNNKTRSSLEVPAREKLVPTSLPHHRVFENAALRPGTLAGIEPVPQPVADAQPNKFVVPTAARASGWVAHTAKPAGIAVAADLDR
jgi:hypothetical protein